MMIDIKNIGRKILERRKTQGLTQEQLGLELGVSGQSVSKWENGETAPDLSLIPCICKVLEISSDSLLDINGGIGIESLAKELKRRIDSQKSSEEALFQALKFLHEGSNGPTWNPDMDTSFDFKNNRLISMNLWDSKGFAVFVGTQVLSVVDAPEEQINGLRTLIKKGNWEIAQRLLKGPAKTRTLLDAGVVDNEETLNRNLSEMIDAGVVIHDRDGYKLDDRWGLIWACCIKALSYKVGLGGLSYNWME